MSNKKFRFFTYALAALNLLLAAIFYPSLPGQIPMHWDFHGNVTLNDKYQIFVMCGMALLFAILFDALPHVDPRKKNYQKFSPYYDGFCLVMQIFLLVMTGVILTESFRPGTLSVPMITMIGVGLLFLFLGNLMPKVKSNFYMGIKTPWTLSSEEVWRKTHRLGGKCFFLCGLIFLLCAFLPSQRAAWWITMSCVLILCLIPALMSYLWWRKEQQGD